MSHGRAFGGEAADTREEIMYATYAAMQRHGYAGISISRIADETDLTKSTFYHHFDGKHDILLSFAEYLLEDFERAMDTASTGDPIEDIYTFLNLLLGVHPNERDELDYLETMGIYLELRSQAINDPDFSEKFTETSNRYTQHLTDIIVEGIEAGVFREVDPEETASFLLTVVYGTILETTTRTDDPRDRLWRQLDTYIRTNLLTAEAETAAASSLGR